jgi:uncharacterized protein
VKINPGWRPINNDPIRTDNNTNTSAASRTFSGFLREERAAVTQEALMQRMEQIQRQGERLARSMTIRELREYKMLVRRFLEDTARKGVGLRETRGWDRRGRSKRYQILDQLDQALCSLADELIETENGKLELLAKLGEIRGLLVNLTF